MSIDECFSVYQILEELIRLQKSRPGSESAPLPTLTMPKEDLPTPPQSAGMEHAAKRGKKAPLTPTPSMPALLNPPAGSIFDIKALHKQRNFNEIV